MTQREKFSITFEKNKVLLNYLEICMKEQKVPEQETVILIKGCNDVKSLQELRKLQEQKL